MLNGHDGLAQKAGFLEKEVVETFDEDDEEGDEEVELVRKTADNTDLVIFLTEVNVALLLSSLIFNTFIPGGMEVLTGNFKHLYIETFKCL